LTLHFTYSGLVAAKNVMLKSPSFCVCMHAHVPVCVCVCVCMCVVIIERRFKVYVFEGTGVLPCYLALM